MSDIDFLDQAGLIDTNFKHHLHLQIQKERKQLKRSATVNADESIVQPISHRKISVFHG